MSSLLINEPPLQVLPSLAMSIGLNEAIVLQQIHYLLPFATTEYDGKKWVYNSYEEWQASQFKFWSVATIKRAFANLQKLGLIICKKLQSKYRNQTNFYTIDYQKLSQIQAAAQNETMSSAQNEPMEQLNMHRSIGSNCTDGTAQNETMSSAQNEPMEQLNMHRSIGSNCTDGTAQNETMSSAQNEPILQENTNRIHTTEYIHESEYAHAQTNDCQNSQQATPTNTADPVTKKQNDKTKPALATSPSTTKKFISAQDLISLGVEPQVANDYLAIRKTKLTQTALNGIAKQSALANMTLARAIEFAAEMGWQSFKADWYFNQMPKSAPPKQTAKVFDEFGNVVSTPHEPHPNSTEAYAIRLQRDAENLKKRLYGESV